MKHIKLTKGAFAIVDDEDYDTLSEHKWCLSCTGYAVRNYRKNGKQRMERMHRAVMNCIDDSMEVDHINGNKLDNRKSNLRVCTRRENSYNTKGHSSSSRYKGVRLAKGRHYWTARIFVSGKEHHLGQFNTEEDAAKAYNEAASKYFGSYARLNNIN